MFKNIHKKAKKIAVFSTIVAQLATVGIAVPAVSAGAATTVTRQVENLDRGVVAVKTDNGVFVSWRRLGTEPADTKFSLYRDGNLVTSGSITNFTDPNGTLDSKYMVVTNDATQSKEVSVLKDQYIEIPLQDTPKSDVFDSTTATYGQYTPGDSSYGDLDGDGEYEIIMLWNPADAKDAATTGQTGKVYMDAYKLDGTKLWRIDMGYNVRAGAHDTQLCIADFDSDGRAEVMVKTADGTIDGTGKVIGDASKGETYESSWAAQSAGKNLLGPQYITVFDGETGAALDTTNYYPGNDGTTAFSMSFGDDFGNRSERYNATIANIHGEYPSAVFTRGYYYGKGISTPNGRTGAMAVSFRNGKLITDWTFDTSNSGYEKYIGQGNHQIEAGDVDGDGKDEIFYGALTWDDDGSVLWCTFQEHGDAMHLGDFDPTHEGLEFMKVYEDYAEGGDNFLLSGSTLSPFITASTIIKNSKATSAAGIGETEHVWGGTLQNAKTGEFYQIHNGIKDTGRGLIANIGYGNSWYVMWGAGSMGYWDSDGNELSDLGLSMNGRIYWDGDLQDELQDHRGAGQNIVISKWNDSTKKVDELFVPDGTHSINSTKGNVNAQGDLIGDWREEFVTYAITGESKEEMKVMAQGAWDASINDYKQVEVTATRVTSDYALRIYTTTIPTEYNFYTLAHDDLYRNSSAVYANCYNQPPHISWYMNDAIEGSQYTTQPEANVKLVANKYTEAAFDASKVSNTGATTNTPATGTSKFTDTVGHWAEATINNMVAKGIVNGMTETTFEPEAQITRAQFTKLIVATLGLDISADYTGACADAAGDWYSPYIQAAETAGLIDSNMVAGGNFLPNQPINREEMASLVVNAAKYKSIDTTGGDTSEFSDKASISVWADAYVAAAVKLGIVNGMGDGTFAPNNNATRAQGATMIERLLNQI